MKYLLDTNTCIKYLNGTSQSVFNHLTQLPEDNIFVCSIVKFELRYGALRSGAIQKNLANQQDFLNRFVSLPFDDQSHFYASQIRANLAYLGTPIGHYDLLIASIAISNNLILVTHNVREFSRVAGLKIEDWEIE